MAAPGGGGVLRGRATGRWLRHLVPRDAASGHAEAAGRESSVAGEPGCARGKVNRRYSGGGEGVGPMVGPPARRADVRRTKGWLVTWSARDSPSVKYVT
ncbi:hypothetical protein GCM10012279_58300 [Micromonospora yangpuensis]|nr:hypothetical protein GCM10012279_58300 [Micromonospora yangpuensis]